MEKKTMGSFLSVLRKANGMTQRELAQRLNVSDKTVSRWERDEGTPDLALIPVLAEIFGVTCDELLQGQRHVTACQEADGRRSAKGEKQRRWLLNRALAKYQNDSYMSMGVATLGLLTALVCNLAFLQAILGFFLGAILLVSAVMCQAICYNQANLSVEDAELCEEERSEFRRRVFQITRWALALVVAYLGFLLPLLLVDAYEGLGARSMLLFGFVGAAVCLLVYIAVCEVVYSRLVRRQFVVLGERERQAYEHNCTWKKRCALLLGAALFLTLLMQQIMAHMFSPMDIMQGIVFEDYDSFGTFMAEDIPRSMLSGNETWVIPDSVDVSEDEEEWTGQIVDSNGTVVYEYVERNQNVLAVEPTPGEGTALPITVYTYSALYQANQKVQLRNVVFLGMAVAELLAVVVLYRVKRKT